jgi:hypothetical protein
MERKLAEIREMYRDAPGVDSLAADLESTAADSLVIGRAVFRELAYWLIETGWRPPEPAA